MIRLPLLPMLLLAITARAADTEPPPPLNPEIVKKWGGSQTLVVAKLSEAQSRGVGLSDPPVYMTQMTLAVSEPLRGELKKGETIRASHSVRQREEPKFPVGKACIVSLVKVRGGWGVRAIEPLNDAELKLVKRAMALPLGWSMEGKKLRSPWAALEKGGTVEGAAKDLPRCDFSGRPALLVGPGATLTVEKVPPKVEHKFKNPDGDGEYTITLKNNTDKPLTVPALLTDGKNILWKESLVILCQDKTYAIPGAKKLPSTVKSVTLKPGESVSTVVNALSLSGPEWPRGGYRIEFQFCLGERSETMSLYYFSAHHDPIRKRAGGK